MQVEAFFDQDTFTLTYVVWKEDGDEAVIIDPVWDYDPASSTASRRSIHKLISFCREHNLKPVLCLETHAHADHLSGSQILKETFPQLQVGIGARIVEVQKIFKEVYQLHELATDGSQFDYLFDNGQELEIAGLHIEVLYTPGHTPACVSYLIEGETVFTGDCLFMPDFGTGRCDFPGGDSAEMYHSIAKVLYGLPPTTKVLVGHDYQPGGRALAYLSTIGEQRQLNKHITEDTSETEFVSFRQQRDAELSAPKLLYPSVQVNIQGGSLPPDEGGGKRYLKIPFYQE